ncbi:MAG: phenylacetate--CoA ligase family protein [Acidobacteria bacterium]|nr:phenylacetate--CoA ligase family protein [Acidobacteriota bacterium]
MASTLKRAYDALPSRLQEVALSVYGVRNRRRLAQWRRVIERLESTERASREEHVALVSSRLRRILAHAIEFVPRYESLARLSRELELSADHKVPFEILAYFPIVSKAEILADSEAFRSRKFRRRELIKTVTSGTTGTPFATWMERHAFAESDALWFRRTLWAGYTDGDWIARLVGDPVVPLGKGTAGRIWRRSIVDRRLYFSTYHLSAETADEVVKALARFKPQFLMGYPSALDSVASLASPDCLEGWTPKAVLFSSEPMFDHQRETVSKFFGVPLRGLYGCAERCVSAAECSGGTYHLSLYDGYVEGQFKFEKAARPARITGLLNRAMPLIRYELGDDLTVRDGDLCSCGRTLPAIDPVVTKFEDSIVTPSGRVVSPSILTWAFKAPMESPEARSSRNQLLQFEWLWSRTTRTGARSAK